MWLTLESQFPPPQAAGGVLIRALGMGPAETTRREELLNRDGVAGVEQIKARENYCINPKWWSFRRSFSLVNGRFFLYSDTRL